MWPATELPGKRSYPQSYYPGYIVAIESSEEVELTVLVITAGVFGSERKQGTLLQNTVRMLHKPSYKDLSQ